MVDQFESMAQFESPEQLSNAVDAEMSLEIEAEQDPTIPAEIDGVPFDHVGDMDSTEDEPELSQYVPPFDVDAALQEVGA